MGYCLVTKSCPTLVTPWTIACQVPLSMGFPRQEYWSGLPFPSPGDPPHPGIEPKSPALAGRFFTPESPGKILVHEWVYMRTYVPVCSVGLLVITPFHFSLSWKVYLKKSKSYRNSLVAQRLKHYLQGGRPGFNPWVGKIPWRRKWQPTPVFLPGKSHGLRSLVGYSPRGRKESDTTERLHSLTHLLI